MRLVVLVALIGMFAGCVDLSKPSPLVTSDAGTSGTGGTVVGNDAGVAVPPDAPAHGETAVDAPAVDAPAPDAPVAAVPRWGMGHPCQTAGECASGECTEGVCCERACLATCMSCAVAGQEGKCMPVPNGEDPLDRCTRAAPETCQFDGTCDGAGACRLYPAQAECAPGHCEGGTEYAASTCNGAGLCRPGSTTTCLSSMCMNGSCAAPCTSAANCQSGFFCESGRCAVKRATAATCTAADQCSTGFCVDGVCCTSACTATCFACNQAGAVGTCRATPAGQDPSNDCTAEAANSCGRDGTCNGSGACRLHSSGTACTAPSCNGALEIARGCDGSGYCRVSPVVRDCTPFMCGAMGCSGQCVDSSNCVTGWSCTAAVCARSPTLALYWRFEESGNAGANDTSGNNHVGKFVSNTFGSSPTASNEIPALQYPNQRSRSFDYTDWHAVALEPLPTDLRPTNDVSMSLFYRSNQVDTMNQVPQGAELVSSGGYYLRLRPEGAEVGKRTSNPAVCRATINNALDGRWHHLAGVLGRVGGMRLYFDGVEVCAMPNTSDIAYPPGAGGLFVARHAEGQTQWDFDGHIDEVRVYARALEAAEVMTLSKGRNN